MPTTQTAQRMQLGRALRAWRNRAGVSRQATADALACSLGKLSKIETGHASVSPLELRTLIALYGIPAGEETETLVAIANEARKRSQHRVKEWLRAYVSLEAEAAEISTFKIDLIPGLLQTQAYMRAVANANTSTDSPDEIDRLVAIRSARQARLLGDDRLQLTAVIDEAAIRRLVGGPDVMREQLAHLLDTAKLPNVRIQLLPFGAGAHASMGVSFAILQLAQEPDTRVVYLEDMWSADYLDRQPQVDAYSEMFDRVRAAAHDPEATVRAIEEAMGEL